MNENYGIKKGKECSPKETILKVESILQKLGIVIIQDWNNALNGHFSVNLRIEGTNLFTNGKGTSIEYALASAYGEIMERIQSMALFRFHLQYPDDVMNHSKYTYAPDEIRVSIEDIENKLEEYLNVFNNNIIDRNMAELWIDIENCQYFSGNKAEEIHMIPFKDMFSEKKVYFPVKMLDLINGSNGMCAGNTYEEAMVQGLSELCERYANKTIIQNRITPPDISIDYIKTNCETSYSMIKSINKKGYDVIVKDCSLGKGLPVVAIIIIDKKSGKFFVKFGAQPNMDIAIERCLTETFQGRNLEKTYWFREYFYSYDKDFENKNLASILHSGDGYYPYEFFMEESSYKFSEWSCFEEDNNNLMNNISKLIQKIGYNIYVRDWSFLSFPTYQIVCPGLSNLYDSLEERVNWHKRLIEVKRDVKSLNKITEDKFYKIVNFMELNGYNNSHGILDIVGLPVNRNGKWGKLKKDYFIALYHYNNKEYEKAYKKMDDYVKADNNIVTRCLRHYILLKHLKMEDIKIVMELKKFYNKEIVFYAYNVFNNEIGFKNYDLKCGDCNNCKDTECYQRKINTILKDIKERYSEYYHEGSV